VFDLLFESATPQIRRDWEEFLADSIAYAGSKYTDRWGVSLFPEIVRVNVGQTEIIVLQKSECRVLLPPDVAPVGMTLGERPYPSARGSRSGHLSLFDAPLLRGIRRLHQAAIRLAADRPSLVGIKEAHSPGVLRYLEGKLGRNLRNPTYVVDSGGEQVMQDKELADDRELAARTDLIETEKEALRKYRCGQGLFRDRVAAVERRCRVTGIADGWYLRASHIRPWSKSNNVQKLDGNNGLLLSPNVDHLFDGGRISFADNGDLLVSKELTNEILSALGLRRGMNVGAFSPAQCKYLKWHRKYFRLANDRA